MTTNAAQGSRAFHQSTNSNAATFDRPTNHSIFSKTTLFQVPIRPKKKSWYHQINQIKFIEIQHQKQITIYSSYRLRNEWADERERKRALMRDGAREITGCRSLDSAIDQIRCEFTFFLLPFLYWMISTYADRRRTFFPFSFFSFFFFPFLLYLYLFY